MILNIKYERISHDCSFFRFIRFSAIVRQNIETALDTMNAFNNAIRTRVIDEKTHPLSEYKEKYPNDTHLHDFVEKSSVTSFEQMISFSDSLVLGGSNTNSFITQLSNFVASIFVQYSEPFRKNFSKIEDVKSDFATATGNGSYYKHMAFPIMFRGGISVGNDVGFFNEYHIKDTEFKFASLNVLGLTYLNAVKLETTDRGPRLFCDKSVVDATINKKTIRVVNEDNEIYEIVWTIEGCEAMGRSSNYWSNVENAINDKLLPSSINLYNYYKNKPGTVTMQYKNLLDLVCTGIVKYAKDKCDRESDAIEYINKKLNEAELPTISISIIDGFLE